MRAPNPTCCTDPRYLCDDCKFDALLQRNSDASDAYDDSDDEEEFAGNSALVCNSSRPRVYDNPADLITNALWEQGYYVGNEADQFIKRGAKRPKDQDDDTDYGDVEDADDDDEDEGASDQGQAGTNKPRKRKSPTGNYYDPYSELVGNAAEADAERNSDMIPPSIACNLRDEGPINPASRAYHGMESFTGGRRDSGLPRRRVECPGCGGAGQVGEMAKKTCPTCSGTGTVTLSRQDGDRGLPPTQTGMYPTMR